MFPVVAALTLLLGCLPTATPGIRLLTRAPLAPAPPDRPGQLPVRFEPNVGQAPAGVEFVARTSIGTYYVAPAEALLTVAPPAASGLGGTRLSAEPGAATPVQRAAVRMRFVDGDRRAGVRGRDILPGRSNYFLGNDPSRWHTDVPGFAAVVTRDVYPGIDAAYYGNESNTLEYDLVVAPGADPSPVRLAFAGADRFGIHGGDLVLGLPGGELRLDEPYAYQIVSGREHRVASRYVMLAPKRVGFWLGEYDPTRPLVIDPTLSYSTYLGGEAGEWGNSVVVDGQGYAYVAGATTSFDFPTSEGAYQREHASCEPPPPNVSVTCTSDTFVTKLTPDGSGVVYSTYFGGSVHDPAVALAVDTSGSAYITGNTWSKADFPLTPGAFQVTHGGGLHDAYIVKLSPDGSELLYSTYLGGSKEEQGESIAVDGAGDIYVAGITNSNNFPTTPGAFQTIGPSFFPDAFVTQITPGGRALGDLAYSTFLGGDEGDYAKGVEVDGSGHIHVVGNAESKGFPTTPGTVQPVRAGTGDFVPDMFVAELDPGEILVGQLVRSTFLGGPAYDHGNDIALDASGHAYVTGTSFSGPGFPTTPGAFQPEAPGSTDAVVAKLSPDLSELEYSTYFGGTGPDWGTEIEIGSAGAAYLAGLTDSDDLPIAEGPIQPTAQGQDAYLAKLSPDGSELAYATFLGGSGDDYAIGLDVDPSGNAFLTGTTTSEDFPVTPGAFQGGLRHGDDEEEVYRDAFVMRIEGLELDIAPPDTIIISAPPNPSSSASAVFEFVATEAGSTFACSLDGADFVPCVSPRSYSGLAEGGHSFQVRATDAAGNADLTPASWTWTVDTTLPDTTPPDTTITSGPSGLTTSSSASFGFSSSEAESTFECSLDGSAFSACTSPKSYSLVSEGSHTFRVRAVDAAGNVDPTPAQRTWTVDAFGPQITILRPTAGIYRNDEAILENGPQIVVIGYVTVQARAADAESGVSAFEFEVDGEPVDPSKVTLQDGVYRFRFEPDTMDEHTISVRATNGSGHASALTIQVLGIPE